MSKNIEIARIFYKIADILETKGVQWKPQAYRKAAKSLESIEKPVEELYRKNGIKGLQNIPGVGAGIAGKIAQYIETGKIKEYEKLKKEMPGELSEILEIETLGPKRVKKLQEKLGIITIKQLETAIKQHEIAKLPGFGTESERAIAEGLNWYKTGGRQRVPLKKILPSANKILNYLKNTKGAIKVSLAGSVRRKKATVRDIDVLVSSKLPDKIVDAFVKMPAVKRVLAKGTTRASVILKNGFQSDLRVVKPIEYSSALLYLTGSKDHNIEVRKIAIKKGYKLSEYGLFLRKTGERIPCKTEADIYRKLGMKYIPPEKREK